MFIIYLKRDKYHIILSFYSPGESSISIKNENCEINTKTIKNLAGWPDYFSPECIYGCLHKIHLTLSNLLIVSSETT